MIEPTETVIDTYCDDRSCRLIITGNKVRIVDNDQDEDVLYDGLFEKVMVAESNNIKSALIHIKNEMYIMVDEIVIGFTYYSNPLVDIKIHGRGFSYFIDSNDNVVIVNYTDYYVLTKHNHESYDDVYDHFRENTNIVFDNEYAFSSKDDYNALDIYRIIDNKAVSSVTLYHNDDEKLSKVFTIQELAILIGKYGLTHGFSRGSVPEYHDMMQHFREAGVILNE